jgi:hypothetical protein
MPVAESDGKPGWVQGDEGEKSDGPQAQMKAGPIGAGRVGCACATTSGAIAGKRSSFEKGRHEGGLAGLSVSGGRLILAERDFGMRMMYRCLNADNGELLWRVEFSRAEH